MILMTARLLKLLFFLAAVLGAVYLSRGAWSKKQLVGYVVLTVIAALVANSIANALPPLTDQVTLTALGQKCEEAELDEIFLDSYTIDGCPYVPGKSLQIVDGKWFWVGESYVWRNETDSRQPDGVTRSVTVEIPVGWSRTLDFRGGVWRGFVEISAGEETWAADTFSEDESVISVPIGRSPTSALVMNQVHYLALYAVLLFLWFFGAVSMIQFSVHQPERYRAWMKRNGGKLCYAGVALISFLLMLHFADVYFDTYSLTIDEIMTMRYSREGLSAALQHCSIMLDGSGPLYTLFVCFWYWIAPYGEKWLLLLPVLMTTLSVYIVGVAGERVSGKQCGFLAACTMGFSTTVWGYCGLNFRNYAIELFFSVLCLYSYIQKNERRESKKWLIVYSISLMGMGMSHYFGMMLLGMYCLMDLYLFLKKKVSWRSVCAYLFPGSVCLAWLGIVFWSITRNGGKGLSYTYAAIPSTWHIVNLLRVLTGNLEPAFWLLLLAVAGVIMHPCFCRFEKEDHTAVYRTFMVFSAAAMIGVIYFYGNCIDRKETMWLERYFTLLIPQISLLCALTIVYFCPCKDKKQLMTGNGIINCFVVLLFLFHSLSSGNNCKPDTCYHYREAADWLYERDDTYSRNKLIIMTYATVEKEEWMHYYVERAGRRDPIFHIASQWEITEQDILSYDKIFLYQDIWHPVTDWVQSVINENYNLETDVPEIQMKVYTRE